MKTCPNCNTTNNDNAIFCATCGTKLSIIPDSANTVANFCTNCGTKLSAGDKFCQNCGAPVETNEEQIPENQSVPSSQNIEAEAEDEVVAGSEDNPKDEIDFDCYEYIYHHDTECYFSMEFYDEEKTGDMETARKVFDYCLKTFDWFIEEDEDADTSADECGAFELNEYIISGGEYLKLKLSEEWIRFIYNKFKPKDMHVVNVVDNSCEDYAENYVKIYDVVNGKLKNVLTDQFAYGDYFDFFVDSSSGYPFHQCSYKKLYPVFKSKTTGKIYHSQYCLEVKSEIENDDYDRWVAHVVDDKYKLYFNGSLALKEDGTPAKTLNSIKNFDFSYYYDEPYYAWVDDTEDEEGDEDASWDLFEFVELEERYN